MYHDKTEAIIKELSGKSITDRLGYWKNNYLNKYSEDGMRKEFDAKVLIGPLKLPSDNYLDGPLAEYLQFSNFGEQEEKRIQYFNWVLYFLAEKRFEEVEKPNLEKEWNSKNVVLHSGVEGKYNKLKSIRENTLSLLKRGNINENSGPVDEVLYLRYVNGCYAENEVRVESIEDKEVVSVCDHHFVFPFLEKLIEIDINIEEKESNTHIENETIIYTHPIFNKNGYLIFDEFVKDGNSWQYDCSYAYRIMHDKEHNLSLIHDHIKPGMFIKWVNENYPDKDSLEEIKTLNVVKTQNREKLFNSAKNNIIKQKNKLA
ncbi:MAG: hypothetical protein JXP36_19005 [Bacteroidales bacterium]|nr:hypothetical protein [Bacteroidales bacterium]